jgi:membrane protein implicated in regulation of membrane protease activity
VVTLFLLLLATDTAMSVWARLSEAPLWLQLAYTLVLLLISSATLWLTWRWLKPAAKKAPTEERSLDPFSLQEELVE